VAAVSERQHVGWTVGRVGSSLLLPVETPVHRAMHYMRRRYVHLYTMLRNHRRCAQICIMVGARDPVLITVDR